MLTQEILKKYVTYDPETGYFLSKGAQFSNRKEGERVGTIHKTKGYRYIVVRGKTYREQRAAFLFMTGEWPTQQVDHINGIKDDNRWVNLRDVSPVVNCENRGMWSNNVSGYKGVCWNKASQKWQVLCRYKGEQIYGGLFENKQQAGEKAMSIYRELKQQSDEMDGYA